MKQRTKRVVVSVDEELKLKLFKERQKGEKEVDTLKRLLASPTEPAEKDWLVQGAVMEERIIEYVVSAKSKEHAQLKALQNWSNGFETYSEANGDIGELEIISVKPYKLELE